MKIGDILTRKQLDQLPVGSVVVYDEDDGRYSNTIVRTPSGFSWIDQSGDRSNHVKHELGGIYVDGWKLVHLPAVPALKVGDMVATEAQAKALPVGTVVVDDDDEPETAPVVKVEVQKWMYYNGAGHASFGNDLTPMDHRILHIPSADTGAVRTAA